MERADIAVIGLGQIGLAVAKRLLAEGHRVTGFRRSPCPELTAAGGRQAASAKETTEAADIVLQCLPGVEALETSGFGPDGVVAAARPGLTVIELSSYPLDVKQRYRDALAARGGDLVEVEVSGTPDMLAEGRAALFVGADPDLVARVEPLLTEIAGTVIPVGGFGAAFKIKLVANLLVASHTVAAAEALALGRALGLDPERVVEVIGRTPAATSTMFAMRAPRMAAGAYLPAPGPIATIEKYLDWIADAGTDAGIALPGFAAARSLCKTALERGLGDHDIAAVYTLLDREGA